MLTRKLAYTLFAIQFISAIAMTVLISQTDINVISLLLAQVAITLIIMIWFLIDIYLNPNVPNRWVWMILTLIATGIVTIAYTVTYVPKKQTD
ncbi:MAG: hypothetical protein AAGC88_06600 [Bacteroidota bacterium]